MSKKELIIEFKKNIHLKEVFTVQEFSALVGETEAFIRKALADGELMKFQPKGREKAKITRQAMNEWFERNSYYENQDLYLGGIQSHHFQSKSIGEGR